MGGLIPLSDASRRPVQMPVVTLLIIVVNAVAFLLELTRGEAFVMACSAVPAQIVSGHHWITILTAMFMHGSWSHIIGNMIFLWDWLHNHPDVSSFADKGAGFSVQLGTIQARKRVAVRLLSDAR